MNNYIMDENGQVHEEPDILKWGAWYSTAERHIGDDTIGNVRISTVFLGIDHQWMNGPPLLFESMVFGGEHDGYQERYHTRDEAIAGHQRLVEMVRGESS